MDTIDIKLLEERIKSGYNVTSGEAMQLIGIEDRESLYQMANNLRIHFCGDTFDTCSIINARSGLCSEDCKWCSQSKFHSSKVAIYPLIPSQDVIDMALNNSQKGVGRFSLVTSGRALSTEDVKRTCKMYESVAANSDIKLCASMGLLDKAKLQLLYNSGVTRYHCNMESAPSMFSALCTTHTQEDKLNSINAAREVGMTICSGGIIGMGESMEQRVEFALYLRDVVKPDSIPINFLNPIKGTQLENQPLLSYEEMLTTIAIFRIINPKTTLRFAGGRGALDYDSQIKAISSGVNGAIVGDLLTTIGDKNIEQDKEMFAKVFGVIK